jgi:hypothetical protein
VRGLAKQLGPTSKMAWENWMSLNMILADKRWEGEGNVSWLGANAVHSSPKTQLQIEL